ncbi:protein phosphatase 2C domain-containing protein [Paraflavitalea sp. CAU 1676]|uniref:protein phosphatase 2C domain-containing protein n=1 Tax=Paraflavitalea sp. CAU 1676 TaxID=3032598 RepID=UPI0023DA3DFE|nr:protein phosphatase 2C domain-containing protein [Paraflavitalea sp. CAU 1676]MDF2189000.1 protein phosphatase 2C domain-containing protein [Paraflavitalea sp. CAU 1676]
MNIYTALQIGEHHIHHCEDYYFVEQLGSDHLIAAVMDGCTMGTDSYFASTLTGKLLRKIVKQRSYLSLYGRQQEPDSPEDLLRSVLAELFKDLADLKSRLLLNQDELLTTLILLVLNQRTGQGVILTVGDGVIAVNGTITEYDQDNKPDYIGFHLAEDFESWYGKQVQKIFMNECRDVSIATDGIGLFTRINSLENPSIDPVTFLLANTEQSENPDMLELKLKKLEHQFGLKPGDDFAIVRIVHPGPAGKIV